jgi:ankyrin repeat protein
VRKHFKYLAAAIVAIGFSSAIAGSYEDWFQSLKRDEPALVGYLMRQGFDPNTIDPNGVQSLYYALREGSLKSAELLLASPKTKVDERTPADETPLMMASLRGQTEIARKLIARGADVNKTGWTPLHYAATSGHVDIIKLLLDESAYIDAESPNGTTPLMMAAHYGTREAARFLLQAGADPAVKNQLGLAAADFAKGAGREDLAKELAAAAVAFNEKYRKSAPSR